MAAAIASGAEQLASTAAAPSRAIRRKFGHLLARAQARAVMVVHRHRQPDGTARGQGCFQQRARLCQRGDGLAQDDIHLRRDHARNLAVKRHRLSMFRPHIGAIGRAERPDRPRDAPRARRVARRPRLGQRLRVERGETVVQPEVAQPVMVDRIGIGRGDRGACREVVGMDRLHEARMVDHHLRGPKRRRPVAGARQQFLPHAPVEKRDRSPRHRPRAGVSHPRTPVGYL